ncbi:UNVERIFIED_CONTAM: protein NUCLEAR FUSION defective, chloroplastic/mitochondrial [Sesamum angustifolium]|uniref:Protein NUCLEAR FUSION defective, chloroplastic/mitochondrial n=1 Tax=Sesamum angustifolium TaxID=2727405 RepID=A0AAW2PCT2_9LAMI
MAFAAASTAARSVFRSSTVRNAATRLASQAKSARSSPFRLPARAPALANRILRSPVEMSACLESMQPYHTATASALMTSMLTVSRCGFGWLAEAYSERGSSCLICMPRMFIYILTRTPNIYGSFASSLTI